MKYILKRDIGNLKQGMIVYEYYGYTYGCISSKGTAFTMVEDQTPFFELPNNAVEPLLKNRKNKLDHLNHMDDEK